MQKINSFFANLSNKQTILVLSIVGLLVYFNSLFNDFIGDDASQIVNNILVHSIKNISTFFTGSTFYGGGAQSIGVYYKPLLSTVFSLLYNLFGSAAFSFHLFQTALHITSAFILFLFLSHFFKKTLALVLALIFLVHPINSESVFYISATQEPLFFFFGILALWTLTKARSIKHLVLVSLLLFLALFSKETAALFLIMSIVYIFTFRKKQLFPLLGLSVLVLVSYFLLRVNAVGILHKASSSPISGLTFSERLFNMPAMLFHYLKTLFFPFNLAFSQHWVYRGVTLDHFFLPLAVDLLFLAPIFFFAVILYKRRSYEYFKIYLFFCLWFLIGILLHLQIYPLDVTVADRWFYFPIVGVLGMIGVLIEEFKLNLLGRRFLAITLLLLFILSMRTFFRSFNWRDNFTLATHDNRISQSYVLENIIGYELSNQGQHKDGLIHVQKSIELYPYITNYNNLGLIYLRLGLYPQAKEAYLKGLRFGEYYLIYENLAEMSLVYGDASQNINFLKSALKKFPSSSKLWFILAVMQYNNKEVEDAKVAISNAYKYNKSSNVVFVYNKIMSDQPLQLKIKVGY